MPRTPRRSGFGARALAASVAFVAVAGSPHPARSQVGDPAVTVHRDVVYGRANGQDLLLDAYIPQVPGLLPAVLLIHGGGWSDGDKASMAEEAAFVARNGMAAFSINYRLAPRDRYPSQIRDAQAALVWVRLNASRFGVDPRQIGALGGSAGGYLAVMLAVMGEGPLDGGTRVAAAVSWSGPMDLTRTVTREGNQGALRRYFGFPYQQDPEAYRQGSPITHVDPTDAPVYLVNSDRELIVKPQPVRMARRLQEEGVENVLQILPGGAHSENYSRRVLPGNVAFLRRFLPAAAGAPPISPPPSPITPPTPSPSPVATPTQPEPTPAPTTSATPGAVPATLPPPPPPVLPPQLVIGASVVGQASLEIGGALFGEAPPA